MRTSSFHRRCAAVAALLTALLLAQTAQAAVVLQVNAQGILTGATGITVGTLPGRGLNGGVAPSTRPSNPLNPA